MPDYELFTTLQAAGARWDEISRAQKTCALLLHFETNEGEPCGNNFFVWSSRENEAATIIKSMPRATQSRLSPATNTKVNTFRRNAADLIAAVRHFAREESGLQHPRAGHAEEFMCQDFALCLGLVGRIVGRRNVKCVRIYQRFSPCRTSANFAGPTGCLAKLCQLAENYSEIKFVVDFFEGFSDFNGQGDGAARAANKYASTMCCVAAKRRIMFNYRPNKPWGKDTPSSSCAPSNNDAPSSSSAPNN